MAGKLVVMSQATLITGDDNAMDDRRLRLPCRESQYR
ncbi:hypothetical protein COLO4_16674 [Corchorus olitorius]|uniref:Uncharacterized protein n=1 Tax=Corchorus olitorius TaxID=93759 RepID=A0A1R3JG70_9ROSI|nr:hypothetical protein COLO4_16674 [Corchorus olitorius]